MSVTQAEIRAIRVELQRIQDSISPVRPSSSPDRPPARSKVPRHDRLLDRQPLPQAGASSSFHAPSIQSPSIQPQSIQPQSIQPDRLNDWVAGDRYASLVAMAEKLRQVSERSLQASDQLRSPYLSQSGEFQSGASQPGESLLAQLLQRLETQVRQVNQLASSQETAILELKALADQVEQIWRSANQADLAWQAGVPTP